LCGLKFHLLLSTYWVFDYRSVFSTSADTVFARLPPPLEWCWKHCVFMQSVRDCVPKVFEHDIVLKYLPDLQLGCTWDKLTRFLGQK